MVNSCSKRRGRATTLFTFIPLLYFKWKNKVSRVKMIVAREEERKREREQFVLISSG
jgi:hypothetical protein